MPSPAPTCLFLHSASLHWGLWHRMLCNGVAAPIISDDGPIIQQLQQHICRSSPQNHIPFPKQLLGNIFYLNKNVDKGQRGLGEEEGVSTALESIVGCAGVTIWAAQQPLSGCAGWGSLCSGQRKRTKWTEVSTTWATPPHLLGQHLWCQEANTIHNKGKGVQTEEPQRSHWLWDKQVQPKGKAGLCVPLSKS